jgi:hypothetical protein
LSTLYYILAKNLAGISHNVPAVYDVSPALIRALRNHAKGRGWQNVDVGMERSGMT